MPTGFQPGEGPSRGLLRGCGNRWIVCSYIDDAWCAVTVQVVSTHQMQHQEMAAMYAELQSLRPGQCRQLPYEELRDFGPPSCGYMGMIRVLELSH